MVITFFNAMSDHALPNSNVTVYMKDLPEAIEV